MTGTFELRLDTTAPVVTFGDAGHTTAGEQLELLYTITEPAIVDAVIELADHRSLPMIVAADRLKVLLPPDTPDGWATVTVIARDDVHNEATYSVNVLLSGTIVIPPEPEPQPVVPGRPSLLEPFARRRDRSLVVATSRTRIRAELHDDSRFTIRVTGIRVDRSIDRSASEVTATTRSRTRVRRRDGASARITETTAIHKRPEGPGAEDDLILLGLL